MILRICTQPSRPSSLFSILNPLCAQSGAAVEAAGLMAAPSFAYWQGRRHSCTRMHIYCFYSPLSVITILFIVCPQITWGSLLKFHCWDSKDHWSWSWSKVGAWNCLVNKALLFPGDSDTSGRQDHTPGIIVLQDSAQQVGCHTPEGQNSHRSQAASEESQRGEKEPPIRADGEDFRIKFPF